MLSWISEIRNLDFFCSDSLNKWWVSVKLEFGFLLRFLDSWTDHDGCRRLEFGFCAWVRSEFGFFNKAWMSESRILDFFCSDSSTNDEWVSENRIWNSVQILQQMRIEIRIWICSHILQQPACIIIASSLQLKSKLPLSFNYKSNLFWSIHGELFCERSLLVIQLISTQKTKSSIHSRRNYFPQMVEIGVRDIRFFLCQVGRIVCCRPCTISACSISAIEILWNTCLVLCVGLWPLFLFSFLGWKYVSNLWIWWRRSTSRILHFWCSSEFRVLILVEEEEEEKVHCCCSTYSGVEGRKRKKENLGVAGLKDQEERSFWSCGRRRRGRGGGGGGEQGQ